ncbi:MAG: hypothetical protein WBP85_05720 [Terracidiphilus sp.]
MKIVTGSDAKALAVEGKMVQNRLLRREARQQLLLAFLFAPGQQPADLIGSFTVGQEATGFHTESAEMIKRRLDDHWRIAAVQSNSPGRAMHRKRARIVVRVTAFIRMRKDNLRSVQNEQTVKLAGETRKVEAGLLIGNVQKVMPGALQACRPEGTLKFAAPAGGGSGEFTGNVALARRPLVIAICNFRPNSCLSRSDASRKRLAAICNRWAEGLAHPATQSLL